MSPGPAPAGERGVPDILVCREDRSVSLSGVWGVCASSPRALNVSCTWFDRKISVTGFLFSGDASAFGKRKKVPPAGLLRVLPGHAFCLVSQLSLKGEAGSGHEVWKEGVRCGMVVFVHPWNKTLFYHSRALFLLSLHPASPQKVR